MYKISVPIINNRVDNQSGGKELLLKELRRTGAQRVFLAIGRHIMNEAERKSEFAMLKNNCEFFKKNGFEVGAWLWTFWSDSETPYTKIAGAEGVKTEMNCPLDKHFVKFMQKYISDIGKCGVDLIQFDDDYRFGHLTGSVACTCELHMKRISGILGEDITPLELKNKIFSGGGNKYRNAWLQANGESLINYAKFMRSALDTVNPDIRMGYCSCMSNWGTDGAYPEEIARALAGNTKPFLRLTGAPYWAVEKSFNNSRLQNIIEFGRMQRSLCRSEVEVFGEGDTFPRPRHNCPASYLEIFDMALRTDGNMDGILKYVLDYYSEADYETGYIDLHCENREIYNWIESHTSNKQPVGVRVYEFMDKIKTMTFPDKAKDGGNIYESMFSPAAKMLADCSVPTVYRGGGVFGAAFDENIKFVPAEALKQGIIIDMRAAEILAGNGIDTGLLEKGEKVCTSCEYFEKYDQYINIPDEIKAYKTRLKDNCDVLSRFIINHDTALGSYEEIPAVYVYKNEEGHKFMVFTFDAYWGNDNIYRSYARSRQIADCIESLSGNKLPAYSYGNPDLYIISKKNDDSMSVCLWNIFADPISRPVIELDTEYTTAEFVNCSGKISGSKIYLSEISPFGFAGFEVKK